MEAPEVQYTRNGSVSLAYQVVGNGPIDLIEVSGLFSHLEVKWEEPGLVRSISDLARFARVLLFDRRGVGLSDRITGDTPPSLEDLIGDVAAVMDATGSRQAVVLGVGDGGIVATAFAASHPERVRALVLYNTLPLMPGNTDGPDLEATLARMASGWGTGVMAETFGAEEMRPYIARAERRACTPLAAVTMMRGIAGVDLAGVLPGIRVPTVVMHYRDHPGQPAEAARHAAQLIPGARYVETPRYTPDAQLRERRGLAAAIEELVTGAASVTDTDRVLAAVLFTDIVGSTKHAAEVGDRRWRDLLDEHDRMVRRCVEASSGRVVKTTGDGVLARFDGVARAVRCAQSLVADAKRLGVHVRAAVHVGECDQRGDDLGGMTLHVAARVLALAGANEILATSTVRETLIGTDLLFEARGTESLRGVPGTWNLFVMR